MGVSPFSLETLYSYTAGRRPPSRAVTDLRSILQASSIRASSRRVARKPLCSAAPSHRRPLVTASPPTTDLPLRYHTPTAWATLALADAVSLLGDHAHLERKAASNALELVSRWPAGEASPDAWVSILAAVARDETIHLHAVSRLLAARGGGMPRVHRNPYASALHGLVRRGQGTLELLDRLLISALIEARSCERFDLLAASGLDAELCAFFDSLRGSEQGHYRVFLHLAEMVVAGEERDRRWSELLDAEAGIIAAQVPGPRMHSGVGDG